MILIKGHTVILELANGLVMKLPRSFGIIHDPTGEALPRCDVFFGAYRKTDKVGTPTRQSTAYFGRRYQPKNTTIDIPRGPWKNIGEVVQILYVRTEKSQYAGKYYHPFKKVHPVVSKCKSYYKLALPNGCILDDRGFVFP